MKSAESEAKEVALKLKELNPDRFTDELEGNIEKGFAMRNSIFEQAGIDPEVVTKVIDLFEQEGALEDICAVIGPELKKAFNVEVDTENTEPGQMKFKKAEKNPLNELGITDAEMTELLTLFAKCYTGDNEEDGDKLDALIKGYLDKMVASAPKTEEE